MRRRIIFLNTQRVLTPCGQHAAAFAGVIKVGHKAALFGSGVIVDVTIRNNQSVVFNCLSLIVEAGIVLIMIHFLKARALFALAFNGDGHLKDMFAGKDDDAAAGVGSAVNSGVEKMFAAGF